MWQSVYEKAWSGKRRGRNSKIKIELQQTEELKWIDNRESLEIYNEILKDMKNIK